MSCAKSVLPAYMAVSTGKPARLPCHSVQVDTAHLPPQTQSISRSPRHDPSVNRTAVISHFESTDDAFIAARQFSVAPKVAGYVTAVPVTDNQHVNPGDVIARIDERDYRVALE